MIKKVLVLFCFVMLLTGALADEWGDVRNNSNNESPVQEEAAQDVGNTPQETYTTEDMGAAETKYTNNFYIALIVGTLSILLVLYIIYLFIRGPSVRWKKNKPIKQ